MAPKNSRYTLVSRRALLKRTLGAGAVVLIPGLACGTGDDDVLGDAAVSGRTATTEPGSTASTTAPATTGTTAPTTEVTDETTGGGGSQTTARAESDGGNAAVPEGGEVVVAFTYRQLPGGKSVPPYIAVWVEDVQGQLVETIELWYEQSRKGPRWLPDLRRWFTVDQARIDVGGAENVDVVSSPTRLAGSHAVMWDGTSQGASVPVGDYFVCIEAARERGPYSLIREPIALNGSPAALDLPDDQELTNASVVIAS